MKIQISKDRWIEYADAVKDFNPIHRSDEEARKFGLEQAIAPGMWLASHAQGLSRLVSIDIKFKSPIKDGDEVEIIEEQKRYSFKSNGKDICTVKLRELEPEDLYLGRSTEEVPKLDCVYGTGIERTNIKKFLNSLDIPKIAGTEFPEMYLVSLSAPALLVYGKTKGLVGMHVMQSVGIYKEYEEGPLYIGISRKGERHGLENFSLYWTQFNKLIASGEASVTPLQGS